MKPSTLRKGQWLTITDCGGYEYQAQFIRREPAKSKGRPAFSVLFAPECVGLEGPDDEGLIEMSDYYLSRRGRLTGGAQ